jgi:hypothetical protein
MEVQNVTSHLEAFAFQQHKLRLIDLHHHATIGETNKHETFLWSQANYKGSVCGPIQLDKLYSFLGVAIDKLYNICGIERKA